MNAAAKAFIEARTDLTLELSDLFGQEIFNNPDKDVFEKDGIKIVLLDYDPEWRRWSGYALLRDGGGYINVNVDIDEGVCSIWVK